MSIKYINQGESLRKTYVNNKISEKFLQAFDEQVFVDEFGGIMKSLCGEQLYPIPLEALLLDHQLHQLVLAVLPLKLEGVAGQE